MGFNPNYAGDDSFEASSSSAAQQALVAGWTSQLEMSATPNPGTAGAEVVFTLRVRRAALDARSDAAQRKAADASPSGTISQPERQRRTAGRSGGAG